MLILKNGYMIDPASGTEGYRDILIDTENGKIARIVPQGVLAEDDAEIIDLNGQMVAPGLVDVHVHFRDPGFTHKEDIHTG
ncbi:MAG: dihydroorotase, partial [Lachnospiraceae bacterium]|nr:dihydroorotase [Lachnospiraceae bacterium]